MEKLSDLPNVGKVLEQLLIEIRISNPKQLREIGTCEAFIKIKIQDPSACIQMLYGLQGAVGGVQSKFLTDETKQELLKFYKTL